MEKILIVDDEECIIAVTELILKKQGYMTEAITTLDMIEDVVSAFQPDLVLLDVVINGQDGRLACERIKAKPAVPKIVLFSVYSNLLDGYHNCKADGTIEKPFKIADFSLK